MVVRFYESESCTCRSKNVVEVGVGGSLKWIVYHLWWDLLFVVLIDVTICILACVDPCYYYSPSQAYLWAMTLGIPTFTQFLLFEGLERWYGAVQISFVEHLKGRPYWEESPYFLFCELAFSGKLRCVHNTFNLNRWDSRAYVKCGIESWKW